jgi:saccharopine dehydrogenase-like NADP-dependent oxidoreductase
MSRKRDVVAVLGGAGAMGRAAVHHLAVSGRHVLILDADAAAARRTARVYAGPLARSAPVDAGDPERLARALRGATVVVHCAPYAFNLGVMQAALEAGCHYVDLGGLFHTTRRQLRLEREFRRAGLLGVLGMGSAPGITNVMARLAADLLDGVRAIRVYNGGADFTRYDAPLAFGFTPDTVLDELSLPPMIFTRGRYRAVAPISLGEDFDFDLGTQRVHASLHSEVATLPATYRKKGIRECAFKIAYDPALIQRMKLLIDLGLADTRPGPRGVAPRAVLLDCFRGMPPPPAFVNDRDTMAVVVEGRIGRRPVTLRLDLTARPQRKPPLSAVARDTGFPAAIVAGLILDGAISERGVRPPERAVPPGPLFAALAAKGMKLSISERRGRRAARSGRGTSSSSRR